MLTQISLKRIVAGLFLLGGTILWQDAGNSNEALVRQQQLQPPTLLEGALKAVPDVKLLGPGAGAAWLVQDMDRDQRLDVVAVVVRSLGGPSEFGVIAVHASAPQEIHWVVPLDVDSISGVVTGRAPDVVVPLFCVDCDGNVWFRWSGDDYEADLYAVGEEIEIGSEAQADSPLYSSASLTSKPIATVPHCTTAVVRKVGGTPEKRWYFVETAEGERGWIPDDVTSSDLCVG